jgi:type IX secretion system substrate protein
MKCTFLCLLLSALFLPKVSNAQSWTPVGSLGFSGAEADYESIAIDRTGVPYVAYEDIANGNKATVMKFNGSSWVSVGIEGFSGDLANFTDIAINNSGTPYVVFQDGAATQKITVMSFDGVSWVNVGAPGFSAGLVGPTFIAFDTFSTPYVAFEDDSFPVSSGPVTVMKYNGTKWVYVGSPRFTAGAQFLALAISGSTPYVVYQDSRDGFKASVMKFDGSNWVFVGAEGFSAGLVQSVSIVVKKDTPYVSFSDNANSNKATVMKYDGTNWVNVGVAGFTPAEADNIIIAIDSASGTPYAAYSDVSTVPISASVMKFNGSSWANVGSAGFSADLSNYVGMAIDAGGTPYVCYQGFTGGKKASVMKYGLPPGALKVNEPVAASFSVFPNPGFGEFTIRFSSLQDENATIVITNLLGEKVKELDTTTLDEATINLNVPSGVYFVSVMTKNDRLTSKILVE